MVILCQMPVRACLVLIDNAHCYIGNSPPEFDSQLIEIADSDLKSFTWMPPSLAR